MAINVCVVVALAQVMPVLIDIQPLHKRVAEAAPIAGVSVQSRDDKSTWLVNFKPEATAAQRSAAASIISTWTDKDWNPPADIIASRVKAEADPLLLKVVRAQIRLDAAAEKDKAALTAARDKARSDYLAAEAKITAEVQD